MLREGRQVVVEGEEYSASPFSEIRLQFDSDDFGPRLFPLAVYPLVYLTAFYRLL